MTIIYSAAQWPTAAQQYDFFAAMIDAIGGGLESRNMTKIVFAEAQASQAPDLYKVYQEKRRHQ